MARTVARTRETRALAGAAAVVAVAAHDTRAAAPEADVVFEREFNESDRGQLRSLRPVPRPGGWSRGDCFALALGAASLAAMALAPYVTPHSLTSAAAAIAEQMRPLPGG